MLFRALTGRVVDSANVIPAAVSSAAIDVKTRRARSQIRHSARRGDRELARGRRHRALRQRAVPRLEARREDKNNGVLLLVAPNEHKVRIEVGYGLEGTLTDALSKIIITNAMAPRFKAGDFGGGIERGVDDIITVLTTDASEWQKRPQLRIVRQDTTLDALGPWIARDFSCSSSSC